MKFLRTTAVLLGCAAATAVGAWDLRAWLDQKLFSPIKISGSKTLGFHMHDVGGDRSTFDQQNYFGDGDKAVTDRTDLYIRGEKVLGFIDFETRMTNNKFGNPYDRRLTFVYGSKLFDAKLGDLSSASLHNTNPLTSFSKTMNGATGTLKIGKGYELKLIGSQTRANARTISFPGNNSAGPYYLTGGNIVDGSLRVRVDDVEMKLGADYTVDYQTGLLNFRPGLIIPPTSTIIATYESYGFNDQTGKIMGGSLMLPFFKGLSAEVSAIQQTTNSGSGLGTRTERFYGYGPPATPYDLQFEPLIDDAHPILVTIDGVPQQLGINYYFDLNLPFRFYFRFYVDSKQIVQVVYTPKPSSNLAANGDKSVYGVAVRWQPLKGLTIQHNIGTSRLDSPTGPVSGSARTTQLTFNRGGLSFKAGFNDIPDTFTTISSTGFRRNEKGQTYDLSYDFGKGLRMRASTSHSKVALGAFGSSGTQSGSTDVATETFGVDYVVGKGTISLNHSKHDSSGVDSGSGNSVDTLRYSTKFGRFTPAIEISNTVSSYFSQSANTRDKTKTSSVRLSSGWEVSSWMTFTTAVSQNMIQGVNGDSNGRDISVDLSAHPNDKLNFRVGFNDSNSGYYNYSGYGNGYGDGYGNGGFSGGGDGYGVGGYGVQQRGYTASAHYAPWSSFSFDINYSKQVANGDNLTNSDVQSIGLGFGYTPSTWLRVNSQVQKQSVNFTSGSGSSNTTLLNLGVSAGPIHRFTVTLDYQRMLTGSNYTSDQTGFNSYNQNLNSYYLRLAYDLGPRQRTFFDARSGNTVGYSASDETSWSVGYEYDIMKFVSLVGAYRVRNLNNLDTNNSAYGYSSRSFDVDLSFHF